MTRVLIFCSECTAARGLWDILAFTVADTMVSGCTPDNFLYMSLKIDTGADFATASVGNIVDNTLMTTSYLEAGISNRLNLPW